MVSFPGSVTLRRNGLAERAGKGVFDCEGTAGRRAHFGSASPSEGHRITPCLGPHPGLAIAPRTALRKGKIHADIEMGVYPVAFVKPGCGLADKLLRSLSEMTRCRSAAEDNAPTKDEEK